MFARRLSIDLKPNSQKEFAETFEKHVLPLLRKKDGFRDGMAFVGANGTKAFTISLWETREHADVDARERHAEMVSILSEVVEGAPRVGSYDVVGSTIHNIETGLPA
jgi:heme-degrading monooxygenase HmoA